MEKIKKWGTSLRKFILKYKFTILTLALLFLIVKLLAGNYNNKHWLIILSFYGFLNAMAKTPKYISIPITIILGLLVATDAYFPLVYGERLSFGIMEALVQANKTEVGALLFIVVIKFSIIALVILSSFFLCQRELKEAKPGLKVSLLIFFSYWLIFMPVLATIKIQKNEEIGKFNEPGFAHAMTHYIAPNFPLFFRSVSMYFAYNEEVKPINAYRYAERVMPSFATYDPNYTAPEKIYVVIGESAFRGNMSLYGYPIKTTPFTDSLVTNSSNLSFYDAIAGGPMTNIGVSFAITYGGPKGVQDTYEYKGLLEMVKNAGYETIWISSQGVFGGADTKIRVFASVADELFYMDKWPPDDIGLVHVMKDYLKEDKKQLFVLHLEGSHFEYKQRYDKVDVESIEGDGVIVDYNRTIHHTDRVLEALYNTVKDDKSSVIAYFSDHGEIIGKGHGFLEEGTEQFEIPMITIHQNYPQIDSVMTKYQDEKGRFSSTNVINVLTEIAGYKYSDEYRKQAIENGKSVYHADHQIYIFDDLKNKN